MGRLPVQRAVVLLAPPVARGPRVLAGRGRRASSPSWRRSTCAAWAAALAEVLLAVLIGLEANSLRRWTLTRRGRPTVDVVTARDRDEAEAEGSSRRSARAPRRAAGAPGRRAGSPAPADRRRRDGVIGLFPDAGARPMNVAIIDYGSGNLHSAAKAFERAAREARPRRGRSRSPSDPDAVRRADRIVLPGVGAFADCRRGLDAVPGMVEALTEAVRGGGRPFLGICVGMQLMATRGLEYETTPGLGWIPGDVRADRARRSGAEDPAHGLEHPAPAARPPAARRASRPGRTGSTPISCIPTRCSPPTPTTSSRSPTMAARSRRSSRRDNIAGTQFHPEKSQALGLDAHRQFPAGGAP